MTLIGKAWRRIQRFAVDIRIDADYPRYELEQRCSHEAAAMRRFDTSQLEREIAEIQMAAEAEGSATFGARIDLLRSSIDALSPIISQLRWQLELLARDYRQELDQLYGEKTGLLENRRALNEQMEELRKERSEAQDELSDAYDDLKEAKSSIDSWYAKSETTPWLFGNGGKRLPKRSLFGQSFGDLEGYKADRSRACDEIGDCKDAIAEVIERQRANVMQRLQNKEDLDRVSESIRSVKEARQRMFDLRSQGVRLHHVETQLSGHERREAVLKTELRRRSGEQAKFVKQRAFQMGIGERENALEVLKTQRAQFIVAFDDAARSAERRTAHREWWTTHHQVAA